MSEEPTRNLPQDGVGLILARLDTIDSRLTALEDKVDRRLQETRPIWEQVLVRLEAVEGQLVSFGGRMDGFEKRLDDFGNGLRSGLRRFDRQIEVLAKDVFEVRTGQRDLDWRMDKMEESKAT